MLLSFWLQYFPRNPGTSFGIGKGMMMVLQLVSASFGYSMELVIGQIR